MARETLSAPRPPFNWCRARADDLAGPSARAPGRAAPPHPPGRAPAPPAGVPVDHAERCLGHVIGGIRGAYDRHEYYAEKKHAFEALAAQIERILDPQDNVVALRP